ncbi:MAG: hypothetical protein EAX96_00195 [Candidatus Lokiarchaeota archaeon]|nr:hypothetical protein [Candidatus Lokiarchaeota archaeon]
MDKIDEFFKKYKGGYFGIAAALIGTIMIIIAVILHSTAGPFNMFTHWISNLGIGPNGSMAVFNIGLIITVFAFTPFIIFMINFAWSEIEGKYIFVKKLLVIVTLIFAFLTLLGLFLVALFPMWPETIIMHFIGAMMFFLGSMFWTISMTVTLLLFREISIVQIAVTIGVVIVCSIFIGNIVFLMNTGGVTADISNFMTISGTPLWVRFWEWMYLFAILAYVFLTSIYILRYVEK